MESGRQAVQGLGRGGTKRRSRSRSRSTSRSTSRSRSTSDDREATTAFPPLADDYFPSTSRSPLSAPSEDRTSRSGCQPAPQPAPQTPVLRNLSGMVAAPVLATIPSDSDSSSLSSATSSSPALGRATAAAEESSRPDTTGQSADGAPSRSAAEPAVRRLSVAGMQQLTAPESLPIGPAPDREAAAAAAAEAAASAGADEAGTADTLTGVASAGSATPPMPNHHPEPGGGAGAMRLDPDRAQTAAGRPITASRTLSTPPTSRWPHNGSGSSDGGDGGGSGGGASNGAHLPSPRRNSFHPSTNRPPAPPTAPSFEGVRLMRTSSSTSHKSGRRPPPFPSDPPPPSLPSPMPSSIPLPPMSIPIHFQLEIAGQRPSPLYIRRPHSADIPYESSAIKFERLKNMLLLPGYLERTLSFGALACLDAWLYTFTILPIRFAIAVWILVKWWGHGLGKEGWWAMAVAWKGLQRQWRRGLGEMKRSKKDRYGGLDGTVNGHAAANGATADDTFAIRVPPKYPNRASVSVVVHEPHTSSSSSINGNSSSNGNGSGSSNNVPNWSSRPGPSHRHRRTPSLPSNLSSFNKADLLQGGVILCTSLALMRLDASKMYHLIRAQSAIKLYVIYNVLEVGDRLLSALGQDVFECLFSAETLARNSSGRSKILQPLGMFVLAFAYNTLHSVALYYQVITLNVAVNSYSNALLTLLLSNQFVEIKSTVFKRIEKDNLFQLTCADIVERFQLCIMLLIIALRNMVEVGGLSVPGAGMGGSLSGGGAESSSSGSGSGSGPLHSASILPHSFTVLPAWLGEVLSPFLIVILSEVAVDTIKHAYVTKFNNIKPAFYSRILDIICKDYYTNAFMTPTLTKRLGLAVIPLSCLFIRSSIQTYHMFLSTNLPAPIPPSSSTQMLSLATTSTATPSSAPLVAALERFDTLLRDALGRAVYGYPYAAAGRSRPWWHWTSDDAVAALTMFVFFFLIYVVMLMAKLLLGMVLLKWSRNRYESMKVREQIRAAAGTVATDAAAAAAAAAAPAASRGHHHSHPTEMGKSTNGLYDAEGKRVGIFSHVEVTDEARRWINVDGKEGLKKPPRPDPKKPDEEYSGAEVERFEMVAKRIW